MSEKIEIEWNDGANVVVCVYYVVYIKMFNLVVKLTIYKKRKSNVDNV